MHHAPDTRPSSHTILTPGQSILVSSSYCWAFIKETVSTNVNAFGLALPEFARATSRLRGTLVLLVVLVLQVCYLFIFRLVLTCIFVICLQTAVTSTWTETSAKNANVSPVQVDAAAALNFFEVWDNSRTDLPTHDHAMLFTRSVNGLVQL